MAKKEPKSEFEAFHPIVCERLRKLEAKRARLTGQREKAVSARDKAETDLRECGSDETKKRDRLNADYGEACLKIDDLAAKLSDVKKGIFMTVEYADQSELFPDPDTFNAPEEDDEKGDGEDEAQGRLRPVGEPAGG